MRVLFVVDDEQSVLYVNHTEVFRQSGAGPELSPFVGVSLVNQNSGTACRNIACK